MAVADKLYSGWRVERRWHANRQAGRHVRGGQCWAGSRVSAAGPVDSSAVAALAGLLITLTYLRRPERATGIRHFRSAMTCSGVYPLPCKSRHPRGSKSPYLICGSRPAHLLSVAFYSTSDTLLETSSSRHDTDFPRHMIARLPEVAAPASANIKRLSVSPIRSPE